ncbi:MAG: hypothetical protein ACI9Y1_003534, partial [Lentisphaeria bacterium]
MCVQTVNAIHEPNTRVAFFAEEVKGRRYTEKGVCCTSLIGASSFIAIGPYSQFVGIKCLRCTKKMGALGSQRGYEKQL